MTVWLSDKEEQRNFFPRDCRFVIMGLSSLPELAVVLLKIGKSFEEDGCIVLELSAELADVSPAASMRLSSPELRSFRILDTAAEISGMTEAESNCCINDSALTGVNPVTEMASSVAWSLAREVIRSDKL